MLILLSEPESATSAPLLVAFAVSTGIWQSCLLYSSVANTPSTCNNSLPELKVFSANFYSVRTQALALYHLTETFGGDLGMILMATITRSVAKHDIRSTLGRSNATEKVS